MQPDIVPAEPSNESTDIPMDKELYHALTYVDIQRVHTTLTIDDFDCIKQDTRCIFYNKGPIEISVLPLPAIKRKVQRNMKVEDVRTRKLVFIPSSSSADLLVKASTHILNTAGQHLSQPQQEAFKEIKDTIQSTLTSVFTYEPEQNIIESACEQISKIEEKKDFWTKDFIKEILLLANLLIQYRNGFYRPLITLIESLHPESYTLIHLSAERVREYLQDRTTRLTFSLLGKFTFSFAPEIYSGRSNHVRIYAPDGLVIKDVEFDVSEPNRKRSEGKNPSEPKNEGTSSCKDLKKYLDKNKRNCFDDRCFYIQLGPEESKILYRCENHFNIKFGRSNLLVTLSLLWWLTALSPAIFGALNWLKMLPPAVVKIILSENFVLALLGLSATFLVAVGIYAIDKKIVNHFITTHIILIYMVLTLEILVMIFMN